MKTIKNLVVGLSLLTFSVTNISIAMADINLGVLAPRGNLKAMKRWTQFADFLTEKLNEKVNLVTLPARNTMNAAETGKVDFLLTNPVLTAKIEKLYGLTLLATLNKKSGSTFAGVIVVKKGSGIKTAQDLKGKKVMSLKFRAAAGAYTFQTYHLMQKGIDPHKDFSSMRAGKKQDDLVLAVKAGVIDAAFVRTGVLESMHKSGKINMSKFTVIDQHPADELKLAHSTDHYPEWYLFGMKKADKTVAEKIKVAAMSIKEGDAVAKKAKIIGFVEPVSMTGMQAALTSLKIAPFDK